MTAEPQSTEADSTVCYIDGGKWPESEHWRIDVCKCYLCQGGPVKLRERSNSGGRTTATGHSHCGSIGSPFGVLRIALVIDLDEIWASFSNLLPSHLGAGRHEWAKVEHCGFVYPLYFLPLLNPTATSKQTCQ